MKEFQFVQNIDSWDLDTLKDILSSVYFSDWSIDDLNQRHSGYDYYNNKSNHKNEKYALKNYAFTSVLNNNIINIKIIEDANKHHNMINKLMIQLRELTSIFEYAHICTREDLILLFILFLPKYAKEYFYKKVYNETGYLIQNELDEYTDKLDKIVFDYVFKNYFTKDTYKEKIDQCLTSDSNKITLLCCM